MAISIWISVTVLLLQKYCFWGSCRTSFSAVMIYVTVESRIQRVCSVCIVLRPVLLVAEAHVSKALNKNNEGGGPRSLGWVGH
jgi:hypothetical protein